MHTQEINGYTEVGGSNEHQNWDINDKRLDEHFVLVWMNCNSNECY